MPGLRVPITFDTWYAAVSRGVFLPPEAAWIEISADTIQVRMSWAFRATFPRAAVVMATRERTRPASRGVHGWRGTWLVNGSGNGILRLTLHPEQSARVMGIPVCLRQLLLSVDDPDKLALAVLPPRT